MSVEQKIKRKKYFIKKKFQTNFVIKFCLLVILGAIISGAILYFFLSNTATTAFVNSRLTIVKTSDYIIPSLLSSSLISIILVGFATILAIIFLSHRIAGALFSIERTVLKAKDGDLTGRVRLRTKDEIVALAESFNELLETHQKRIISLKKSSDSLQQDIDKISQCVSSSKEISPEKIKEIVLNLNIKKQEWDNVLNQFTTS